MSDSANSTPLPKINKNPRQTIERWIEYLIDCLDHIDPDPDLEENGDYEPYLAGSGSDLELDPGYYDNAQMIYGGNEKTADQAPHNLGVYR